MRGRRLNQDEEARCNAAGSLSPLPSVSSQRINTAVIRDKTSSQRTARLLGYRQRICTLVPTSIRSSSMAVDLHMNLRPDALPRCSPGKEFVPGMSSRLHKKILTDLDRETTASRTGKKLIRSHNKRARCVNDPQRSSLASHTFHFDVALGGHVERASGDCSRAAL